MPRRYHTYPEQYQVLHDISSVGAIVLASGYLLPAAYLTWSLLFGEKAPDNPWRASGLEWRTSSPPITHNFHTTPKVRTGPYDYAGQ